MSKFPTSTTARCPEVITIVGVVITFLAQLAIHAWVVCQQKTKVSNQIKVSESAYMSSDLAGLRGHARWYVFAIPLFAAPILPFNEIYESLGADRPRIVEDIGRKRVPRLRQRCCDDCDEGIIGYIKCFAAYSREIE